MFGSAKPDSSVFVNLHSLCKQFSLYTGAVALYQRLCYESVASLCVALRPHEEKKREKKGGDTGGWREPGWNGLYQIRERSLTLDLAMVRYEIETYGRRHIYRIKI